MPPVAKADTPVEPGVGASVFAVGVNPMAFAGLLADEPSLRDAELTPAQWQKKLDAYLQSPRP